MVLLMVLVVDDVDDRKDHADDTAAEKREHQCRNTHSGHRIPESQDRHKLIFKITASLRHTAETALGSALGTTLTCTGSTLRTCLACAGSTTAKAAESATATGTRSLRLYDNLITGLGKSVDVICKLTLEILLGQLSQNIAVCKYCIAAVRLVDRLNDSPTTNKAFLIGLCRSGIGLDLSKILVELNISVGNALRVNS